MAKKTITYKEAYEEMEQLIRNIESNEYDVDELTEIVKKVNSLILVCKDKLRKTEEEIEKIISEIED
ncbi:MAG: exodeoxyribonuclease VII small subunit [Bacteroidales bacterium]|nr:exodeoxyribonuclease VII small subunit [Bacteroidales bacterium]